MILKIIPAAVVLMALYWILKPIWAAKKEAKRKYYSEPRVPKGWHEKNKLDVKESFYHE